MIRKFFFIATTALLILSVLAGIVSALDTQPAAAVKTNLENVRSYAAASQAAGLNYAVDGGQLFVGRPGEWRKVATPEGVIVGPLAVDSAHPGVLYMGAANDLAIYRTDGKDGWMRVALSDASVGGVTSIALDKANRMLYVGTDTAGVFRLRDVGSSMIASGHTELDAPVVQVATDSTGAGLVFARTRQALYQGENMGLAWNEVTTLGSTPTALEIVNGYPATVYVGTADRGLLTSQDGLTWSMANDGLAFVPGSRLSVDAITADPAQLDVLYVATSYRYGSTTVHQSPAGVHQTTNGGATWQPLVSQTDAVVAELLPVAGQTGAVYALTAASRQPLAIGAAPVMVASTAPVAPVAATGSIAWTTLMAWIIAGLAALALGYVMITDLRNQTKPAPTQQLALRRQPVNQR
ncbi:MAG: hypothetical protein IAE81_23205 [Caldilineaceae bacterium]|jgi:hypothetical protein|nr:hypothetical protein [Caldilineaceae bacterium]